MQFSKSYAILAALAAAESALAHTTFTEFYIDGVSNGPGTCIRMNTTPGEAGSPIPGVTGNDMACGILGTKGVDRVCTAKAGATITFEYHSWADDKSKQSLDPGHKGPCAVYMKKVDSAIKDTGNGDGWFKIWDEGYKDGQWCTNRMIKDGGFLSVEIPQLAGGYYLIRPELLALHAAGDGDPQFYAGCAQVFLESNGDLGPTETVSIPGYVSPQDEALTWNIYYGTDPNNYPQVGPKVATLSSGATQRNVQTSQTEGLRPEGCILENGNFCAFEVPEWNTETECWASGQNCWDQQATCWGELPPTGGKGCDVLNERCEALNAECEAKRFTGPPNAGEQLNHPASTLTFQAVPAATNGGGVVAGPSSAAPVASATPTPEPQPETPVEENKETPVEEEDVPVEEEETPVEEPETPVEDEEETPAEDEEDEAPIEEMPSYDDNEQPSPPATTAPPAPIVDSNNNVVVVTNLVWETKVEYVTVWVK